MDVGKEGGGKSHVGEDEGGSHAAQETSDVAPDLKNDDEGNGGKGDDTPKDDTVDLTELKVLSFRRSRSNP